MRPVIIVIILMAAIYFMSTVHTLKSPTCHDDLWGVSRWSIGVFAASVDPVHAGTVDIDLCLSASLAASAPHLRLVNSDVG